jgi:hypothetical protein
MKFRKKPIIIDALQFNGVWTKELSDFCGEKAIPIMYIVFDHSCAEVQVKTPDGRRYASIGDWIIKGTSGEFYPCKPDIFEKIYEEVEK